MSAYPAIVAGARVRYSRQFLRNIAAYTGPMPFMRGTVQALTPMPGMRDGITLAHVLWDDEGPHPRGVLTCNLWPCARAHVEPV